MNQRNSLPSPEELLESPELAVLANLTISLDLAVRMLIASYPEVECVNLPHNASCLARLAAAIVNRAADQQRAIDRYRTELELAIIPWYEDEPDCDIDDRDIPF